MESCSNRMHRRQLQEQAALQDGGLETAKRMAAELESESLHCRQGILRRAEKARRPCSEYRERGKLHWDVETRESTTRPLVELSLCAKKDRTHKVTGELGEPYYPSPFVLSHRSTSNAGFDEPRRVACADCNARSYTFLYLSDEYHPHRGVFFGARNGSIRGYGMWTPNQTCRCCRCILHFQGRHSNPDSMTPISKAGLENVERIRRLDLLHGRRSAFPEKPV
jgi:hypothetical protein